MSYFFMINEKMDRLAGIIQTTECIYWYLPRLALGIIIALAVIMFFRSRSKAKSEAGPDLSLRLAAASSIIYAAMLLVLFFTQSVLMLYVLYALSLKDSEFSVNAVSDPGKEAFALLPFMLAILTCIFAVWQIVLSRRLLKRNITARNMLIGLWLWNFFMLSFPLVSCRVYGIIGLLAGIWTLWVIAIRKDASGKISKGYKNMSLVQKVVLILAAVLAIPVGITGQLMTLPFKSNVPQGGASFESSLAEEITGRIEKLYIMTGSDDRLTRMTADLLAEKITEKTGIPCKVVSSSGPLLKVNMDRAAALYIERGEIIKPPLQNYGAISEILNDKVPQCKQQICLGGKKGFKIKTMQTWASPSSPIIDLDFPNLYFNFSGTVSADASNDTIPSRKSVEAMLNSLIKLLKRYRSENAVAIPDIKLPAQESPPLLKIKGLKDARLIFLGEGLAPARLEVYSFKKGNYDSDLAVITEVLEKRGLQSGNKNEYDGQFIFSSNKDNARLDMGYRIGYPIHTGLKINTDHGLLIVVTKRKLIWDADPEFMNDLIKKDLKFFVLSHGLSKIEPELRQKVMRDFFNMDGLSVQMVKAVLESLPYAKLSPEEKLICEKGFFKVADALAARKDSPDFLKEVQELKNIQAMDSGPVQQQFMKKFADIFCEAKIPGTPDKDGLISKSFEFPVANTRDFSKIIEISFETPGYDTILLPVGLYKLDNNTQQLTIGNGTSIFPNRDLEKKIYTCLWDTFSANGKKTLHATKSSIENPTLEKSFGKINEPNELLTELSFDTKKKCVRLSVVFRPQKNTTKK